MYPFDFSVNKILIAPIDFQLGEIEQSAVKFSKSGDGSLTLLISS